VSLGASRAGKLTVGSSNQLKELKKKYLPKTGPSPVDDEDASSKERLSLDLSSLFLFIEVGPTVEAI
jgi:hypothetical protein